MPLQKETVSLNFGQGLDTLDDPNQVPLGKFTSLVNTVFIKSNTGLVGALKKRNGFQPLPATVSTISYICNYNESIVGLGQGTIQQFSPTANSWFNQGFYQPLSVSAKSLIRNSYSQSQQDSAIAANGIGCVAYSLGDPSKTYKYSIFDSSTGQIISGPTTLQVISTTTYVIGQPKTFTLGSSFFVVYGVTSSANASNGIVATKINTSAPFTSSTQLIAPNAFITNYVQTTASEISSGSLVLTNDIFYGAIFDGVVASSNIVLSQITSRIGASGNNVIGLKISPTGVVSSATVAVGSYSCAAISVCFDTQTSTVFTTIGSGTALTYLGTNYNFSQSFSPVSASISSASLNFIDSTVYVGQFAPDYPKYMGVANIGSLAVNGTMFSFYDVATFYGAIFQSARVDNICLRPMTSVGVLGSESVIGPSLGLASKPFVFNGSIYTFATNQDNFQPSYYLINSTGLVISQFAYGNAGPFYSYGVPSPYVDSFGASVSYLKQDLLVPQNTGVVGSNTNLLITNPSIPKQESITALSLSQLLPFLPSKLAIRSQSMVVSCGVMMGLCHLKITSSNFQLVLKQRSHQLALGLRLLILPICQLRDISIKPSLRAWITREISQGLNLELETLPLPHPALVLCLRPLVSQCRDLVIETSKVLLRFRFIDGRKLNPFFISLVPWFTTVSITRALFQID